MSANTLTNRANGQTILDTFFNDIHSALDGDFVGRGATGIPTAGQNLGTIALPWGAINATSLVLNGSALDVSQVASPSNRVVSGKKRTTSNQPAFLTPSGSGGSVTVAGGTTSLVLSIVGAAVTVSSDIVKTGLTLAPSSNNTCLMNDSTAAGQAATRTWGEYGAASDMTVDTMGSNITSKVGTFQAFKVVHSAVTEYFTAFVESTTKLTKVFRGFYYDASLNPVNPVALSDNDVITLMSRAHLFMTNDAATVDASYTTPTYGAVSPTSPATGDYWFDTVNQVWKRYDGASFQIINRTLIGIAVMDSTNCVAARCVDFYAGFSSENSIELEVSSTSTATIRNSRRGMRVSVAGKTINYDLGNLPTWVGASTYAGATDIYAAFAISTQYYLYVKDDGTTVISDIEPLYRPDLLGFYHRHNPWRCIGQAATDGSSNWISPDLMKIRHEIWVYGANGYGSTGSNKILRFSTVGKNVGSDITYLDDSANGNLFTINRSGLYAMSVTGAYNTSGNFGVTVNANTLTGAVQSVQASSKLSSFSTSAGSDSPIQSSITAYLNKGDLIRAHGDGTTLSTTNAAAVAFRICKVSD